MLRRTYVAVVMTAGLVIGSIGASASPAAQVSIDGPGITGLDDPSQSTTPASTSTSLPSVPTSGQLIPVIPVDPAVTQSTTVLPTSPLSTSITIPPTSTTIRPPSTSADGLPSVTPVPLDGAPSTAPLIPSSVTPSTKGAVKPSSSTTATTLPPSTPAELRSAVLSAVGAAGGQRSVLVVVDGKVLVDDRSTSAVIPASTQKLYVAGVALQQLGAGYQFETQVLASQVSGSVTDLVVVGSGDPSFTSASLRKLAAAVKSSGVTAITGNLLVDDSRFDRVAIAPGWKPSFSPGEAGLLSAFMVDGNHRNEPIFRADPALSNLLRFQTELQKIGVQITARLGRGSAAGMTKVASHKSEPLDVLVSHMGKKSNNTYAEMILKELGVSRAFGSTVSGATAVQSQLDRLGVIGPTRFVDGSGLSSLNRTSAASEVSLLSRMDSTKARSVFRSSLAVSCVDGTMKSRFCNTPAAKKVVAKTGTIDGVAALSGYTVTASGKQVVFAFLLNDLRASSSGRVAIDAALLKIVSYVG